MASVLELCTKIPVTPIAAGTVLLEEGRNTNKLVILAEGKITIHKQDILINEVSKPGSIFGETSVLLENPHMATVTASEPSRIHLIEDAKTFLEGHPALNLHLATLLAARLHGVTGYLVDLKSQYEDRSDHLGMVDDVLETLLHHQPGGNQS